mgnify:CR=1 FL=1
MSEAQALERERQRIEELCAAAIRALAGQGDLHFRGGRLHRGLAKLPAFAPHLHPALEDGDDFASFRGAADGLALRLAHSDPALHQSLVPEDVHARLIFELLEQIRVESLVDPQMPGVGRNLAHRFERWSLAFHHSGLTETLSGLILYTVAQVAHARVHGVGVLEATEDLIETTRGKLVSMIGPDLAALRRTREDQAAYAPHAKAIAERIATLLRGLAEEAGDDDGDDRPIRFSLWMDFDARQDDGPEVAVTERSQALDDAGGGYRVFTTAYDQQHHAADLVRAELLREYRERLDACIAESGLNARALARQLKAVLAEPTHDGWDGAQEEGRIDGARLAQLVVSPAERRLFRDDRIEPVAHTALTFLIDCSGSMKQHAESVAMMVDTFARALEMAGATSEILGFTTGAWNGGRAARDWKRAGQPRHPGRLNERCHLVFKDADTAWRRARPAIGALLKADLFREGFDGEAVDWAVTRLLARDEPHRILIVVSDGCPMDGATQLANDATYLDQHLLQVVQRHEQAGAVQILGVGVGLDLSVFYSRCQAIDLDRGPRPEVMREIVNLIAGSRRR